MRSCSNHDSVQMWYGRETCQLACCRLALAGVPVFQTYSTSPRSHSCAASVEARSAGTATVGRPSASHSWMPPPTTNTSPCAEPSRPSQSRTAPTFPMSHKQKRGIDFNRPSSTPPNNLKHDSTGGMRRSSGLDEVEGQKRFPALRAHEECPARQHRRICHHRLQRPRLRTIDCPPRHSAAIDVLRPLFCTGAHIDD